MPTRHQAQQPEQLPLPLEAPPAPALFKTLNTAKKLTPREVCERVGSTFMPPDPLTVMQVALDSLNHPTSVILNATRQHGNAEWNGWVIWGGTEPPDASFNFKALKVVNVLERLPQLMPYLALANGFSLSLSAQEAEIFPPKDDFAPNGLVHSSNAQSASDAPLETTDIIAPKYVLPPPPRERFSRATKLFFLASLLLHITAIIFIGVADPGAEKGSENRAGRASWAGLSVRLNPLKPQITSSATSTSSRPSNTNNGAKPATRVDRATMPPTPETNSTASPAQNTPSQAEQPPPLLTALPIPSTAVAPMRDAPLLTEPIAPIIAPSTTVAAMRDQPLITTPIAPITPPNTALAQFRDAPLITAPIAPLPTPNTAIATLRDAPILNNPIAPLTAPSTAVTAMRDAPILANPITPIRPPTTAVAAMRDAPILTAPIASLKAPNTTLATMRDAPILNTPLAPIAPPNTTIATMRDAPILAAPIAPLAPPNTAITAMREAPLIANAIPQLVTPKVSQQLAPAPVFAPTPAATPTATASKTPDAPPNITPNQSINNPASGQTNTATTASTSNASGAPSTTASASQTTPLGGKTAAAPNPISSTTVDNIFGAPNNETKPLDGGNTNSAAAPSAGNKNIPPLDAEAVRQRIRDATRNRETGDFMAATEKRPAFTFPLAPKVVRKTKEELAIEQAWKPDCRTAYKDSPLGLAAIGPLIWGAVSDNAKCKW